MKIRTKKFEESLYYVAEAVAEYHENSHKKEEFHDLAQKKRKAAQAARHGQITVFELLRELSER